MNLVNIRRSQLKYTRRDKDPRSKLHAWCVWSHKDDVDHILDAYTEAGKLLDRRSLDKQQTLYDIAHFHQLPRGYVGQVIRDAFKDV